MPDTPLTDEALHRLEAKADYARLAAHNLCDVDRIELKQLCAELIKRRSASRVTPADEERARVFLDRLGQQTAFDCSPAEALARQFAAVRADACVTRDEVVLPREPTPEMERAYFAEIDKNMHRVETSATFGRHDNFRLAYKAMLLASSSRTNGEG